MAQGGWTSTAQTAYGSEMAQNFMSYMGRGTASMMGFEPTSVLNPQAGAEYWRFGTGEGVARTGALGPGAWGSMNQAGHPGVAAFETASMAGKMHWGAAWGMSLFNPAMLGLDLAQGFAQGGVWGAKDALVWNMAQNAAMASHVYSFSPDKAGVMVAGTSGLLSTAARGLGAGVGATIGQSMGGSVGAFAGAYIGAAPLKALSLPGTLLGKIPHVGGVMATTYSVGLGVGAAGALGVGMAAATTMGPVYAAYKATQFGAQYHNQRRNINTAGDLSAFMTNNASTQRARSVQAINRSHINTRSALGLEATFLHTRKSYGSNYRQGWM